MTNEDNAAGRKTAAMRLETLAERDKELEALWENLSDVPFEDRADGDMVLANDWMHFPRGTEREEIWRWFDARHSKGVYWLLYREGGDKMELLQRQRLCEECISELCVFNPEGICCFPLLYGRKPLFTEEDGCADCVLKNEEG